jgi:AraC family transcriptional regulator, transcriptional activator FtrA
MPPTVNIMPKRLLRAGPANPRVVAIAYDGLCTFEFGCAVEVFGLPRPEMGDNWYRFAVAGTEPSPLRATGGVHVIADGGLDLLHQAGTVIVPGWRSADAPVPQALCEALRGAHAAGARILSLCSGAFVLAAAGLLDDRAATTHWRYAEKLVQRHPRVRFVSDVLYVDEGDVLTAAGSAAGLDLCLHLVRRDFGPEIANQVARRLVLPAHRQGGQAQYVERPVPRERAGGSRLTHERIAHAQDLLEKSSLPIEDIATACGFGSASTLRHHFRAILGTSPAAYRTRFTTAA